QQAGLTQMEVAERMGTKTPAVARLEAGGGRQHHAPSLATLRKYAAAVGCRLEVKLVPLSASPRQEREKPSRHKRPKQKPSRSPTLWTHAQRTVARRAPANSLRSYLAPAMGGA